MFRAVRPVGLMILVALSLLASSASRAQPGEARLPTGQRDGLLIPVASCTSAALEQCKAQASQNCGNNSNCIAEANAGCAARCELEN